MKTRPSAAPEQPFRRPDPAGAPGRAWANPVTLVEAGARPRARADRWAGVGVARFWPLLICLSMPVSAVLIAIAYADAAGGDPSRRYFNLFWLGLLSFLIPAGLRLLGWAASRTERLTILLAFGAMNVLPKFLATPDHFLYHDELAHWRQAELIFQTGKLFIANPSVYISQFFPGLQTMTVALRDLTGLTTFQIAILLILCTHAAVLIGIFLIGETLTGSARAGGVAALIYSLNPGFMYFDSQYSYESVAFVYVVWVTAAVTRMERARDRQTRWAWFSLGLVLAAACIITHHLSSYALIGMLWLITLASLVGARRGWTAAPALTACFAGLVSLGAVAWLVVVAPEVINYLAKPIDQALHQLSAILSRHQGSRALFARSTAPAYEHYAAYGSVLIALVGAGGGLLVLRRGGRRSAAGLALAAFGLLYFAAMPLMLTGSGNEGARRSWTFSYIGLAVLVAPALVQLGRWAEPRSRRWRRSLFLSVIGLLCVVQIGNVSMNTDALYRFPGPYVYGSETHSTTAELLKLASWLRASQGPGRAVVADYYTSQIISSFALDWTPMASASFPVWQLYFDPTSPSPALLHELETSQYQFLIVDERMTKYLPYLGAYFQDGEAGPQGPLTKPPSPAVVNRFAHLPWAIRIYQSDNYVVYRLNYAAINLAWRPAGASR